MWGPGYLASPAEVLQQQLCDVTLHRQRLLEEVDKLEAQAAEKRQAAEQIVERMEVLRRALDILEDS